MESPIPGPGDQEGVLRGVDDIADAVGMGGEDGLFAGFEVDSGIVSAHVCSEIYISGRLELPPHIPIQSATESFIIVSSEAYVQDRGAMLELL
jgi:hypothetical protein